jgi:hypothetical protein
LAKACVEAFRTCGVESKERKKREQVQTIRKRFEQHLGVQEGSCGVIAERDGSAGAQTTNSSMKPHHRHSICVGSGVIANSKIEEPQDSDVSHQQKTEATVECNKIILQQLGFGAGAEEFLMQPEIDSQRHEDTQPYCDGGYSQQCDSEDEENIPMVLNETDRKDVATATATYIRQHPPRRRKKRPLRLKKYVQKAIKQAEKEQETHRRLQAWGVVSTCTTAVASIIDEAKGQSARERLLKKRAEMQERRRDSCAEGSLLSAVAAMAGIANPQQQGPMQPRPRSMSVIA